jgi:hypothetical protein
MPSLAETAGLFADRTRAAFCQALLDGRAWTASELARHAGVGLSTASEQLSRLVRYVRLAGPETAALIEALVSYDADTPRPRNLRESVRVGAEARARTCYDHLAGRLGVAVADAMTARGLVDAGSGLTVTPAGLAWLSDALDFEPAPGSRRPLVRSCLDWTERRPHLAGALGAALCAAALERRWVRRVGSGRAVKVTPEGARAFEERLGLRG